MVPTLRKLTKQEEQRLREIGVFALYIFGSYAEGTEAADSDFDFAVLVREPNKLADFKERNPMYNKLFDFLAEYTGDTGAVIDIVFLQREGLSLELMDHILRHGKLIFDGEPIHRAHFEEEEMLEVADFQPFLRMMNEAAYARV